VTIAKLLERGAEELSRLDLPRLEAMVLLSYQTKLPKEKIFAQMNEKISNENQLGFFELVKRRRLGEPSAYIVGKKEFYGRDFIVTKDVLIPRPDTEILVEEALKIIENSPQIEDILDLCCGSSAIITSIASELKNSNRKFNFYASDISSKALEIAKKNANRYGAEIEFYNGDLFTPLPQNLKLDMIATNPPYLDNDECDKKIEDGWREPDLALRSGDDGLYHIRKIIKESLDILKERGYLLIEASGPQMSDISALLSGAGFKNIRIAKDLAGIERTIIGQLEAKP